MLLKWRCFHVFVLFHVLLLSLPDSRKESDLLWQEWLVGRMLGPILRRVSSKRSLEQIDDGRAKVAFVKYLSWSKKYNLEKGK